MRLPEEKINTGDSFIRLKLDMAVKTREECCECLEELIRDIRNKRVSKILNHPHEYPYVPSLHLSVIEDVCSKE